MNQTMSENSRSPNVFPWDRGEVCKAANGACLPPRKRLLAGLKQNGWLPSTPPRFQGVDGDSFSHEEPKLKVDSRETNHEYTGNVLYSDSEELKLKVDSREANLDCTENVLCSDSPICDRSECKTVEELVSICVKSKRAIKRRKSLSVLADCQNSVRNLQTELLKSCSGVRSQEKVRGKKVFSGLDFPSKREKPMVYCQSEMVIAAKAAAAKAAKAAADAKAVAFEKAVVAAKAAEFARAALESAAIAAECEVIEHQPRAHLLASCEQTRISEGLKGECESESMILPFSHLHVNQDMDGRLEKKSEKKIILKCSSRYTESTDDDERDSGQHRIAALQSIHNSDTVLARMEEDNGIQSCQVSFGFSSVTNIIVQHDEAKQRQKLCSVACSMPHVFDDEKLARQLHRAMNSSPRISRSRACLESCKKSETLPYLTDGCRQISCVRAGRCSSSRKKKQLYKDKLGVCGNRNGKRDIKTKSMTAINNALNMFQKGINTKRHVLGSARFTAKENTGKPACTENASVQVDLNSTFASLPNRYDNSGMLSRNCGANDSHKDCLKTKRITHHRIICDHDIGIVESDDNTAVRKRSLGLKKLRFRRRRQERTTVQISPQGGNGNRVQKLPSTYANNQFDGPSYLAFEQTASDLETSICEKLESSEENRNEPVVPSAGSITSSSLKEMAVIHSTQHYLYCRKSNRATNRPSQLTSCVEKPTPGQKILQLANGSKGKQGFEKSFSLHLPSSAAY